MCFLGSRIFFVAARDGILPDMFSGVHRTFKTPMPAILLQVGIISSLHLRLFLYGKMEEGSAEK